MRLFYLAVSVLFAMVAGGGEEESLHPKMVRKVLARNPDRWSFAKNCAGPQCGCFANGCYQNVQACFGLDCYSWQCLGPQCRCPDSKCLSGCIGDACVLEIVQVDEYFLERVERVPSNWIWTDNNRVRINNRF